MVVYHPFGFVTNSICHKMCLCHNLCFFTIFGFVTIFVKSCFWFCPIFNFVLILVETHF